MDEQSYIEGSRRAWIQMLQTCLRHLGYDSPEAEAADWITEREEAIARLRQLCAEHGDNDWENDLHLADIIDKHLADYLQAD